MTINCKAAKNTIERIFEKKKRGKMTAKDMDLLHRISEAAAKTPGCDISKLKGGRKRRRTKRRKKTKRRTKRRGKKSRRRRRTRRRR
jgi:hypothetical protein